MLMLKYISIYLEIRAVKSVSTLQFGPQCNSFSSAVCGELNNKNVAISGQKSHLCCIKM